MASIPDGFVIMLDKKTGKISSTRELILCGNCKFCDNEPIELYDSDGKYMSTAYGNVMCRRGNLHTLVSPNWYCNKAERKVRL